MKEGAVLSKILSEAGDILHAAFKLPVPAAIVPHAALVTYLVLILYPVQLSAVGGVFAPQVTPLSKLYSMLNPAMVAGGVTTIARLQAVFTNGAEGAAGKTTKLLVSVHEGDGLV